ncbi:IS66-like element accessory protein TnpA [Pandoraea oxalativorans]|uniref:Transposase n=1 Tax=Pandoraea oxalativorans TaxID=573737 RepID=A0A0G3IDA1_9BURK|nr:transposase [Pandoraea oxalativorans]AKK24573.1 hypothetical protein MB84_27310 [Pandoraea oxalativorans]
MKQARRGRRVGSKNYTKEFRAAVVAQANDPTRSIAEVALAHGLNANMVAQWRRRSADERKASLVSNTTLLPVDVVDMPLESQANRHAASAGATPLLGVIEVQIGKALVRIDGPVDAQVLRTVLESLR